MTLRARFVDSISATPTVRLDLTTVPWSIQKSSRFDPPSAKRAQASTLLTDGAIYPASAYNDRILELHLLMRNATNDDAATAIQTLARELDRPANFFEYRLPDQTNSVFFRTVRLAMDAVDIITTGEDQFITAPVIAEPFGYGLRENPVVAATISTDPAAGSNGCFVDVTGVKGDVESPALIRLPVISVDGRQTLFATRRKGTPSAAPFLFQAEAMTQGTNTTIQANDANFSGAGSNYSRCTFGTATMQTRLSLADLGTASVDLRGRYRVYLRCRKNTGTDGINLQLRWGGGGTLIVNTAYAAADTTGIVTADLGEINIPVGFDPVTDPDGVELQVSDVFNLELQAERTSGTGSIDFDFLVLVPADDRLGIVEWAFPPTDGDHWFANSHDTSVHARDSSGRVVNAQGSEIVGGLPMLSPNQTNRVYILRNVNRLDAWTLTTIPNVNVSYLPRYLTVRPAST